MPTLSHSQIELWQQCPAKWRLLKLDHFAEAPSEHLLLGTAVHAAIEADMRRRARGVRHSAGQTGLELLDVFARALRDDLAQRDPAGVLAPRVDVLMRRGRAIIAAYAQDAAPRLYPLPGAIEEAFTVDVPGLPGWQFTGRMDARTQVAGRAPVICDFKTGKPWPVGAEHAKDQASAYLWADGVRNNRPAGQPVAESVAFVTLPDSTAPDGTVRAVVDIRQTRRTPAQIAAYADHIRAVAHQIEQAKATNDFPARTGPLCCWCGVMAHCQAGSAWVAAHPAMATRAGIVVAARQTVGA